jgi:hypothetical protein
MADSDRADWQGVGASFRTLGARLKEHAVGAGDAMRSARTEADGGAVEEVTSALKAAMAKLDQTTTDPDVAAATRDATARLLDAIKAELTGEGRPGTTQLPEDGTPPA